MNGISRPSLPTLGMVLVTLAALCAVAYGRALSLPLISDDYLVIGLGREYGRMENWGKLLLDPLYRSRATSMVLTWWLDVRFGLDPLAHAGANLLLHIADTFLLFAFGYFREVGLRRACAAAAFFAIYEGHQEAVIWFSAAPELLVFLFGLAALWLWMFWLERQRPWILAAASVCYLLALLSKESAVAFAPILAASWWLWRKRVTPSAVAQGLAPFALLTLGYVGLVFAGADGNHHFRDGTFSLAAPFWLTLFNSTGRLFWIWGLAAAALVLWLRPKTGLAWLLVSLFWIGITLLPYSFLTYQTRVPSRHTYLASAGLALLVGFAWVALEARSRRAAWALGAMMVVHNVGYLWTYKHAQYVARAAPTEELIRLGKQAQGPIFMESWPYSRSVAEYTLEVGAGKPRSWLLFAAEERGRANHVYSWKEGI